MSIWSSVALYSLEEPSLECIDPILSALGVSRVPYLEIEPWYGDPVKIEVDDTVSEAMAILRDYGSFRSVSIPPRCVELLNRFSSETQRAFPEMRFVFSGSALTIGEHELFGYRASEKSPGDESVIPVMFSLELGGGDPEAEFRKIWKSVQGVDAYREIFAVVDSLVENVQADMFLDC